MKILVCDDEPEVNLFLLMVLEPEGYEVETAFDGQDALEKILATPNSFDVLITDNRMPRLTGVELIHELRALNLSLKIIMMTGFELENEEKRNLDGFLMKPFGASALLDCLNEFRCLPFSHSGHGPL